MKGVINKGIQELVEARFGTEAWKAIKARAGCNEPFFAVGSDYSDQSTLDLVEAAAAVSGLPVRDILVEFGKFWVTHTGAETYASLYRLTGRTTREFLLNMNRVHSIVSRHHPGATPPRFDFEECPDGRLLMHYRSERNLCTVFEGLIQGVGLHFGEDIRVRKTACKLEGETCCTMEITFA